ncbi:MAG: TIGR02996 domain-containing protein [Planctomycetes bacterium]|nr:TIGR02996 domain-containing protein [Planctomycetota bacterium]
MPPRPAASPLNPDLLALLSGCRAAPADDTPRLVLADWLDENADSAGLPADDARARAALIRVQVELARPTCDIGRLAQLRGEEARLLAANAARWLGTLARRLWDTRRRPAFGFAAHLAAARPTPDFDPLATNSGWRFHRGLLTVELYPEELDDAEFAAWFASPPAAWVEEAGVDVAGLSALERLRVPDAMRPYLGVRYALGAEPRPTMRIGGPRPESLNAKSCKRLLRSENFGLVRTLRMYQPAIKAGALRAMVEANVAGLRRLSVRATIDDASAAFLARAPLESLSALDVSGCDLGPDGFRLLVGSPHLRQLTALVAFRNHFGCDGLVALAASPLAGRLTVLEIQNTGIGDRGVAAVAESSLLERLVGPGLNLSMNAISDAGAEALAQCPHLAPFTELILRDNRIGNAGARALAASPGVANLTYLDLWKNRIGDPGARALAASPHLGDVRELSLRDNAITARGAGVLQERFGERVKV